MPDNVPQLVAAVRLAAQSLMLAQTAEALLTGPARDNQQKRREAFALLQRSGELATAAAKIHADAMQEAR